MAPQTTSNSDKTGAQLCHFDDLRSFSAEDLRAIIERAKTTKAAFKAGTAPKPLVGKVLAMVFDKPSTRTRVSFDVGMRDLGGTTVILSGDNSQIGRDETMADTARVLSRYVDAIMIRTKAHDLLMELMEYATVPVINGLTDDSHPCQIMADIMTFEEHCGPIKGCTLTWIGDGNNVLSSFLEAAVRFDFKLRIATPEGREADARFMAWALEHGADITVTNDAAEAAKGSDCIITDTWVSMGQEGDAAGHNVFQPFQVNDEVMAHAKPDAIFMHCLPAHRGEEVTASVIDGPQSVVFDEAENRLHAQKAILQWCFDHSNT